MAERAKLKYNGKSYYEEDMLAICKKELKFNGLNYLSYSLDRINACVVAVGYKGNKKNTSSITIPFGALAMYNVGKDNNALTIDGVVFDDRKLMQVGNNAASLWGGSCIKYHVDKQNKVVEFECIEHGEVFGTSLAFHELKEYLY